MMTLSPKMPSKKMADLISLGIEVGKKVAALIS